MVERLRKRDEEAIYNPVPMWGPGAAEDYPQAPGDVTTTTALLQDVEILRSASDRRDLHFAESLLIKTLQPPFNAQNEGFDKILNIFKPLYDL